MNTNLETMFLDILKEHFQGPMDNLQNVLHDDDAFDESFELEFKENLGIMCDRYIPEYIQTHPHLDEEDRRLAYEMLETCKNNPSLYKERVKLEIKILLSEK